MSKLRFDPLKRKWTVIAPERALRPIDLASKIELPNNKESCPFCPGNEAATPKEILRFMGLKMAIGY